MTLQRELEREQKRNEKLPETLEPVEGSQPGKLVQISDSGDQSEATSSELRLLREHKLQYEAYIAQGGFDFINTKVLHAVENPYAACLKKKRSEEQRLPTPSTASNTTQPSSEQLVEEIETLKKRIRRMNELFTAQTNRFRDAVDQLTGWHVEMSTHENKLRIRSRYSRSEDDYLELLW